MELRAVFSKGTESFATRVWPKLSHLLMVTTGSMETYANLIEKLYAPGVKQISYIHGGTEFAGPMGEYGLYV